MTDEALNKLRDDLAKDFATAPLGFSGKTSFDEKEYSDFKAGFDAALEAIKYDDLTKRLSDLEGESIFGEKHEAYRYRQIHQAVDQMGGWANFRHWVNRHSKEYFKTCDNLEKRLERAEALLKRMNDTLWQCNGLCFSWVIAEKTIDCQHKYKEISVKLVDAIEAYEQYKQAEGEGC